MLSMEEFGQIAKVLLDLHLEDPKKYDQSFILEKLFSNYEKLERQTEKED